MPSVQSLLDSATADPTSLASAAFVLMNKNGETLLDVSSGVYGLDAAHSRPLDNNGIYWIASCTKLASSVLAMIAVEEGKIELDNSKQLVKLCPELKSLPIIKDIAADGSITLVPHKTPITLRMLLSHTAGFSYSHNSKELAHYCNVFGINEGTGLETSILQPLLFEPGSQWRYGVGIDWACVAICRAYQQSLESLMSFKIFVPLGITDTKFVPTESMKSQAVSISFRTKTGSLVPAPSLNQRPLSENQDWANSSFQYGGSGLYARPNQFIKLCAMLLNDGVSPHTHSRILSRASVDAMFTNQIPQWPNFGRDSPMTSVKPFLANSLPEVYPQKGDPPQGWGLSFFLNLVPIKGRRAEMSAFWSGITNTYYWIDRKTGVTGFLATQVFPFGDEKVIRLFDAIERQVYKELEQGGKAKL